MTTLTIEIPDKAGKTMADLVKQLGGDRKIICYIVTVFALAGVVFNKSGAA